MEVNAGEIVERVVRRNKVSISELARRMQVNRRSVYNWFDQKTLRMDIICKIGYVLGHDFSVDFPDAFGERGFAFMEKIVDSMDETEQGHPNSVHYWMVKYISLLEKYNELLAHEQIKNDSNPVADIKRLQTKSFSTNVYESDSMSL
ncbi:helix-turn-helix domain-containing protein [Daejeonella oryzae]|uniref:helix-turn-helix domain-containing protein n=1 Tax=Daejeonella oryzae TaxID=1122943 RepID=UPI0004141644|nr:transcriptional regulator [Daejeonella oryzae]